MPLKPPSSYGTTTVTAAQIDPQTSKDLTFTSRPKPQTSSQPLYPTITPQSVYPTRRPWPELFSLTSFSVPHNYADAMARIKRNTAYFRVNYTMAALFIVFLSLLWHPISMIVFLIILVAWLALYFFRTTPVVLFNQSFDDRVVAIALGLVTVVALVFTHVGLNVLVALIIAVVIIGLHAAFRVTEDLFLDEETAAENGLVSVVASHSPYACRLLTPGFDLNPLKSGFRDKFGFTVYCGSWIFFTGKIGNFLVSGGLLCKL